MLRRCALPASLALGAAALTASVLAQPTYARSDGALTGKPKLARRSTVGSLKALHSRTARIAAVHTANGTALGALDRRLGAIEAASAQNQTGAVEVPPVFDAAHYPHGINANFLCADKEKLDACYGGGGCGRFENPTIREIARNVPAIVAVMQAAPCVALRAGDTVLDVGAGTGVFAAPLLEVVGQQPSSTGQLVQLEVSEGFVALLRDKAEATALAGQGVVRVEQCSDTATNVEPGCADVALMCDVYHHLSMPLTFMRDLRASLRDGGKLVLIDFHRDDARIWSHPPGWVEQHVRAGQDEFRAEIEAAGFTFVEELKIDGMTENYCMVFRK